MQLILASISHTVKAGVILTLALMLVASAFAFDGELDPYFRTGLGVNGGVHVVALQPDGKILIGGWFTQVEGTPNVRIARLHPDGSVDTSFRTGSGFDDHVYDIAVQPDGKIVVAGQFSSFDGEPRWFLTRLNSDGSRDTSFAAGDGAPQQIPGYIQNIVLQPDGKIIVGGNFKYIGGASFNNIARLNSDGTADPTFTIGTGTFSNNPSTYGLVYGVALQSDGKIVIGGAFHSFNGTPRHRIARLMPNGTLDTSFNPQISGYSYVSGIAIQPDGKIIFGGGAAVGVSDLKALTRLNTDGSLDPSFTRFVGGLDTYARIAFQPDGRMIVSNSGIARYLADGSPDPSFVMESGFGARASALQPDGQLVIGGQFMGAIYGSEPNRVARLSANGSYDRTFAVRRPIGQQSLVIQPDGKMLFAHPISRRNRDGSFDPTFDPGTGANEQINLIALEPDGRMLIAGYFTRFNGVPRPGIARLNANGSLDQTFVPATINPPQFTRMKVQADRKILLYSETSSQRRLVRLNADGSLDTGFSTQGLDGFVGSIVLQPDGKILLGGASLSMSGSSPKGMIRLNYDGSHDLSFNVVGSTFSGFPVWIQIVTLQPDGKVLIGGKFIILHGLTRRYVARLNSDGSVDTTFTHDLIGDDNQIEINDITLQRDGKILIARAEHDSSLSYDSHLERLEPDGRRDPTFVSDPRYVVNKIALEPDGNIIGVGTNYEDAPWIPSRRGLIRFFNPSQAVSLTTVSGRVTSPAGLGVRNTVVTITDSQGVRRSTTTSSFGIFTFDGIPTGTYLFTVASKRYRFSAMSVQVTGPLTGIELVGQE